MANKRMFSLSIIDTDAFLDMPISSQLLYFHLVMRADDEGFIGSPKKVMRLIGVQDDDLKVLTSKRFVIDFEGGIIVIKHWLIHNTIRMDRFNKTNYQDEKKLLEIKENKAYTEVSTKRQPNGNQLEPQVKLSKVKLSKDNLQAKPAINKIFDLFYNSINPNINYANKTQRSAIDWLVNKYGLDKVEEITQYAISVQGKKFAPVITTPYQLKEKMAQLAIFKQSKKSKITKI